MVIQERVEHLEERIAKKEAEIEKLREEIHYDEIQRDNLFNFAIELLDEEQGIAFTSSQEVHTAEKEHEHK